MRNVNHRADDPRCPCRQEYLDIRQRITSKYNGPTHINANVSNANLNTDCFPQSSNSKHVPKTYVPRSHYTKSYSEVAKNKIVDNNNNDDISNERLLEIFFDAVDALEKCQTKYDKLRVLGMMLQHAI